MIPPDLRGRLISSLGYSGFPNYMDILSYLIKNNIFIEVELNGISEDNKPIWTIYLKTIKDKEIYIFANIPCDEEEIFEVYNLALNKLCYYIDTINGN